MMNDEVKKIVDEVFEKILEIEHLLCDLERNAPEEIARASEQMREALKKHYSKIIDKLVKI